ncbi:MAG TPA: hypothetical protein PK103_01750 [Elusimicrobiales bacterium]|nr:hypothetical protein [Elusimicrobiales bacterium]HOL62070.1 hypothetical protein [Elusimicrobiales bacterium]HPO95624.1 hypothetical protein [Elusimicrobiales bacterium]
MKKAFFSMLILFFVSSFCFSQSTIDLSDLSDKKTESKKADEKKTEKQDVKKSTDTKKNQKNAAKKTPQKNTKSKKPANKNGKNYKYKFEKKEEAVYKFDEKGNPIIPKAKVVKSTDNQKSKTDLSIGVEDKEVNLKGKK